MNIYQLFPSDYLRAADLNNRPFTLTIERFAVEEMGQPPEEKPVVYFEHADKGLVLNKTNAMAIASLYGPETDAWVGKRITIYPTQVQAFGKMQDAIRVKPSIPPAPQPPKPTEMKPKAQFPPDDGADLVYSTDVDRKPDSGLHDEVSFDDIPGATEQRDIPNWRGPVDAQMWAMETGACKNEYEARNSWKKVVTALGGFGPENKAEAFKAFYDRQQEKLAVQAA